MERLRIDKWLWAARFYKTRSLAVEDIDRGRITVNGQPAKPSREVKPGDTVEMRQPVSLRTLKVLGLSNQRGPAPVAQALYEETSESRARHAAAIEQRRYEPARSLEHGRPTKRDRRDMEREKHDREQQGWGDRWSASHEP
jgi:ribosome-associated heat shock protein Hsp15